MGSRGADDVWLAGLIPADPEPAKATPAPAVGAAGAPDPLIRLAKLQPPRLPRDSVARADVLHRLQRDEPATLTLFEAPAGFGKTVAMAQWRQALIEAGYAVAWLSLDADDRDPSHFALCLVACLRRAGCEVSDSVFATFRRDDPESIDRFQVALLNELWQARRGLFLFVDDLQRAASPVVTGFLLSLAQQLPDSLRMVLGSSGKVVLPFQYLRSRIAVIDTRALTFGFDEARVFFDARLGFPLAPDDLRRLYDATQGWPVAMHLAVSTIRSSPDPRLAIQQIAAQSVDIAGYLVDDALGRLSREGLDFFVRTAFLENLHPDLCAYVTGTSEAAGTLDHFAEQTVFLQPVLQERRWFRFLPLFADHLRSKFELLPAAERASLHARAASWLGAREHYAQAVQHALAAGRLDDAVDWVAQGVRQLILEGKILTTLTLIARIPRDRIEREPRLQLAIALVLSYSDQYPEAERLLAAVEQQDAGHGRATSADVPLIRARIATYRDDVAAAEQALQLYGSERPPEDPVYAGLFCNAWSFVHAQAGRYDEARRVQMDMLRWPPESRGVYSAWLGRLLQGMTHLAQGELARAAEPFQQVLAETEARSGRRSVAACMAAAGLAFIAYEGGRLGEVLTLLADRMDVIDSTSVPELLVMASTCYVRTLAATGDAGAVAERLRQWRLVGVRRGSVRIEATALAEELRWQLAQGNDAESDSLASRLAQAAARAPDNRQVQLAWQLSRARLALARGHWVVGLDLVSELMTGGRGAVARLHGVQVRTLQAACLRSLGQPWLEPLREAWQWAEQKHLCHSIADEGRVVTELVAAIRHERLQRALAVSESYVERLSTAAGGSTQAAAPYPAPIAGASAMPKALLTDTERQIVAHVAKGLANKQIAGVMGIGLSTVKWHLHNIAGKLDAPSRRVVADIARRRGWL